MKLTEIPYLNAPYAEKGMSQRENWPLSKIAGGQYVEHQTGIENVDVCVYERPNIGVGWLQNTWRNRHLSGQLFDVAKQHTKNGERKAYKTVTDIYSAPLRVIEARESIQTELEAVTGTSDVAKLLGSLDEELDELQTVINGLHWFNVPDHQIVSHAGAIQEPEGQQLQGEKYTVIGQRELMFTWQLATPEQKHENSSFFAGMVEHRTGARNPKKRAIGEQAAKIQAIDNNPGAMLATTLKLPDQLEGHQGQLSADLARQILRGFRIGYWLVRENAFIENVVTGLKYMQENPKDKYMIGEVGHPASLLRFVVQPTNLMKFMMNRQRPHSITVEDPMVLQLALDTFEFARYHNGLLMPFRRLDAQPKRHPDQDVLRETVPEIDVQLQIAKEHHRLTQAHRPNMSKNEDPLRNLLKRFILSGEESLFALQASNIEKAKYSAQICKRLLKYYCLENDLSITKEPWYRYQLRG